jgi:hypothetical protein
MRHVIRLVLSIELIKVKGNVWDLIDAIKTIITSLKSNLGISL